MLPCRPCVPFCLLHFRVQDSQTPALPGCSNRHLGTRHRRGSGSGLAEVLGERLLWSWPPGPWVPLAGASSWLLGPGSLHWKEQMDCKIQVSVSQWPPCDTPHFRPRGAKAGANSGFPQRTELFMLMRGILELLLSTVWASPQPECPYPKQGSPQDFLLSMQTRSGAGGGLLDKPLSPLCLRAWRCPLSGAPVSPLRGQATREPGLGQAAKPLESQQGEWWAGQGGFGQALRTPYIARPTGAQSPAGEVPHGSANCRGQEPPCQCLSLKVWGDGVQVAFEGVGSLGAQCRGPGMLESPPPRRRPAGRVGGQLGGPQVTLLGRGGVGRGRH